MRKKTIKRVCDNIFWYALYLLPVIAYFLQIFSNVYVFNEATAPLKYINFHDFAFYHFGEGIIQNNIIYQSLMQAFGVNGVVPLATESMCFIGSWFVTMFLVHLLVDFILFIPRLCHKWLGVFEQNDD